MGPNSTDSPYHVQYAAIHQEEAFHDGSDVAVFASGPFSHLFQGVQEQSYIAHVLAYAMCIGHYTNQAHCGQSSRAEEQAPGQSLGEPLGGPIGRVDQSVDASSRTVVTNNPSLGRGSRPLNGLAAEHPVRPSGLGGGPLNSLASSSSSSSLLAANQQGLIMLAISMIAAASLLAAPCWR